MKPADLDAITAAIRGQLAVSLPAVAARHEPADLDLEAGVIAARWDGAELPPWFGGEHFYAVANRAIFEAVDGIRTIGLTPTPTLIARALAAGGAHVHHAAEYALDVYSCPVTLDVYEACTRLHDLARMRAVLARLRAAERVLSEGREPEWCAEELRRCADMLGDPK